MARRSPFRSSRTEPGGRSMASSPTPRLARDRAEWDLFHRCPGPRHGGARRCGAVALVLRWLDRFLGGAGRGGGCDPVDRGACVRAQAAGEALDELLAHDQQARVRQVSVVDSHGAVAVQTGDGCIPYAGHVEGDGFSAQANMMAGPEVWPAMADAFRSATGPLARRLLTVLDAAEAAGGDVRGRQSAALVVVPADGEPSRRTVELRIEDHTDPLGELRRLLDLADAYAFADEADT